MEMERAVWCYLTLSLFSLGLGLEAMLLLFDAFQPESSIINDFSKTLPPSLRGLEYCDAIRRHFGTVAELGKLPRGV